MDSSKIVERAFTDAGTASLGLSPGLGTGHVLSPEGERAALSRPDVVDGAATVPEDTVEVRLVNEADAAIDPPQVLAAEGLSIQCEIDRKARDLGFVDPDVAVSSAAVAAAAALEVQAVAVPRRPAQKLKLAAMYWLSMSLPRRSIS